MIPEGERDIRIVIWENIEKYRIESDISAMALCKKVGYDHSSYYKNKKSPTSISLPVLQRFAFFLNVKTIDLIEDWSD